MSTAVPTAIDSSKAVVRRMFELVGQGDLDRMLDLIAEDFVVHTAVPGIAPGRDGFRTFMNVFFQAFPEQSVDIHAMLEDGDLVAVRHTHHVVHGGPFAGLPPTGRRASVDGIEIFRVADGMIAEMWHQDDLFSLMRQLGGPPDGDPASADRVATG